MSYGLPNTRRPSWMVTLALLLTVPVVWIIATSVDTTSLGAAWDTVGRRPLGLLLALGAFGTAFLLRSIAWSRLLPDLTLAHSWAGIHLALGGNHILPLRLGEPLRIASVVRRAGIDWRGATASTITLRSADLVSIGLIGAMTGAAGFTSTWAVLGVVSTGTALVGAGVVWMQRLRKATAVALPGFLVVGATIAAWALEAVVVHQAANWVGVDLSFGAATLVTSAAVLAQVAAFTPGGFGTYEAGGVAALTFLGVEPGVGLAVVLAAHALKTGYSLLTGMVAVFVPSPGMVGRLRLRRPPSTGAPAPSPVPDQPVVLFMPAHNEAETIASVVERVPTKVMGHPVICLVVDDGSRDDTARAAHRAGAVVFSSTVNRGLGAAVRTGLELALSYDPAAIAFCDADGEYAPEELERMVRPILEGVADYVVGSRFAGEIGRMLPHRRLGNLVLTRLLSWVARRRIGDGQSGYRALSRRAAAAAEVIHDFNYAQVLTLDLMAKGMRYDEVPISYSFRTAGRSFIRPGPYLRAVIPAMYREVNTS